MLKKCHKANNQFFDKFEYFPEVPFEVIIGEPKASEEYCRVLQKCIDDNFDYTIELYGTPAEGHSWEVPDVYID